MDEYETDPSMNEVMDEIGKGEDDIVFTDSNGLKNACRPSGEYSDYTFGRRRNVYQVNAFYWAPDLVARRDPARTFALKIFAKGKPSEARIGELNNLLQLTHKHVIRYFAAGITTDNEYCVLMKFCTGKTLTEFIKSNKMYCSTNVLVDYTFQMASGLRYLHEHMEFIHGYIVPTSILMKDSTGKKLKIANLDRAFQRKSARSSEEQIKSFQKLTYTCENSSFMSPEMMPWLPDGEGRNRRPLSSSTDIWSLGCVVLDMYLVREGQPRLRHNKDFSDYCIIQRHVREGFPVIPQIPKDMPDELKVLVGQCLKANPDDRPTAATLLNYADRASLMLETFDLREITATAMVHDEDRSSGTFMYTFKDCFSDLEFGFRRIPAGYAHRFKAHGPFGFINMVDAFYLDDGNPVEKHAGNQACRFLFEEVTDAKSEELKSLLQLKHPNILQYIVIGYPINRSIQDNHYCLLMEWCSGITLRNFIERNPTHCSTKRIVTYTFQVASALHYLHEEVRTTKFIHGNITTSNIMMKESTGENVKIIDIEGAFQQPRGMRQSKKQFNVEGSFYFMSPEMAAWLDESSRKVTRPTPDSPTDIYSLGCVIMDMYFASQGQALWPDHDVSSIRSALQSDHPLIPRMPENSPDEIKVLARQCLQVNPSDRPTAATILNYVARVYGNPHFKCAEDGIQYYLPNSKKLLGNIGAFGVVHRVDAFSVGADLVKQSKRYLALKTFFQKLEQDEIENIETTLLKLNHPNIVKYLAAGFFEHDHQFIMIMECCSGGTLRKAAETALPVEKQKYYVNQLICGIHYLHINDPPIVHKNLKGSNVVFSDENKSTLKICDVDSCSVSRRVDQQSVISRVRFTEGFASPELWKWWNKFDKKGEYPVGRATDIWSLGAVVLEMYCRGNLPDIPSFQRGEILRTTTVADANVDIPPIGEELLAFAAKCLVNEPEKRPTIEQLRDKFSKGFSTASSSARKSDSITVMIEIGKGNSDIFFKDSDGYDNICRPTADNPYFGRGRFGHVIKVNAFYLNPHPVPRENHAETYALKILNRQVAPRDGRTDKLETLLHLEHEHVIGYIAVGTTTDGVCHILMEFCSGMKLNEFIKSNAMYCTNNDIVDYTFQLASGLRYLHGKRTKFIHGDIKSTNILMKDSTGKILKIVDLDRSFQRKPGPRLPGEEMEVMEPCTFMSPEMMVWLADDDRRNRRRPPDISTDIWSLGCVVLDMYLMREGQEVLWFNERLLDFDALLVNIKARIYLGPQIPEDMPDELKVLAGHCLKVNPDDRPTAATLVKYADRVYYKCTGSLIQYYLRPSIGEYDLWGGFGIVQRVKAFSVDAGFVEEGPRYLALKTFHQALHEDEIVKIQTLPKLEHSNIVRYFTKLFFDQDSRYRLIMEWCSGGTLTEAAAAERGLSVEQQKTYTNQLIQGIHYLHVEVKPSIVYKDLKGINVVFLDKNKTTLKICDLDSFSVSRKVGQQSYISRVRFTRGFASPELFKLADMFAFKGDYPVGRATDIWSLGAVVLEMYCKGILPMPEYNTLDDNFPSTPAPYKPAIPEDMQQELKSFVSKCMALLPKDRPIIQDLRDDFSDG